MFRQQAANAYAKVSIESAVLSAPPAQLTSLLFEGALNALARAHYLIDQQQVAAKGRALSQAIDIIESGLSAPLAEFPEDALGQQLRSLFSYIIEQLMLVNLHNDLARLAHCQRLLTELYSGWKESLTPST